MRYDATKWGQRIKDRRQELGLSMGAVAERVGCSISAISRYESGSRGVPDSVKAKLAEALDIDPAELFSFSRAA